MQSNEKIFKLPKFLVKKYQNKCIFCPIIAKKREKSLYITINLLLTYQIPPQNQCITISSVNR